MALRGDDEIDSLLALMGSGSGGPDHAPPPPSSATSAAIAGATPAPEDDTNTKEKTKKRKKKSKRKSKSDPRKRKKTKADGGANISFVDTRLVQNCFEWPRCTAGPRLILGHELANRTGSNTGSTSGTTCGTSAASRELCLRSSAGDDINGAAETCHPLSIVSLASIIVAGRNARCLVGEHHPAVETAKGPPRKGEEAPEDCLLPPLNSVPSDSSTISDALDVYTGEILRKIRKMRKELLSPKHRPRNDSNVQKGLSRLSSTSSLTGNDVQLLQEKASALVGAVQDYKNAVSNLGLSEHAGATKEEAIDLVEKRLAAMAACDILYYRCYYAAAVSPDAARKEDGAAMTAIIPHPPTYFSCPGLAWDARKSGVEALRIFLGECETAKDLAAPLHDSTRRSLQSWGLIDRLADGRSGDGREGNPLLLLWQSRFMETVRHIWCTRYSRAKSPMALRERRDPNDCIAGGQASPSDALEVHDTIALSPAVGQWRDSIRDYPANFYSYASPTEEAFRAISDSVVSPGIDRIVEAGAGTGYWSALLRSHLDRRKVPCAATGRMLGVSVPLVAYDIAPPSPDNEEHDRRAERNEYHGNVPQFTKVHQADSFGEALSELPKSCPRTALLICYPPPGSDMAERALAAHISNGGHSVIHIGEWQGLTGDPRFESLLTRNFHCRQGDVVRLPCWGTDATYLSIWHRRDGGVDSNPSYSPGIGYSSAPSCSDRARRRCRYARCLQYYSAECYAKHSPERMSELALHMIHATPGNDVRYNDDCHFAELGPGAARPKDGRRSRKRRKNKNNRRGSSA